MSKYAVSVPVWASVSVRVEADSEEAAIEKAESLLSRPNLCHHCSRELEVNDLDWDNVEAWEIEK